jgi:signal recognition particle GTPase
MFDSLSDKPARFSKLRGQVMTEENIRNILGKVLVLLELTSIQGCQNGRVKDCNRFEVLESYSGQQVIKIVHDDLFPSWVVVRTTFSLAAKPVAIMLVGLQGPARQPVAANLPGISRLSERPAGSTDV